MQAFFLRKPILVIRISFWEISRPHLGIGNLHHFASSMALHCASLLSDVPKRPEKMPPDQNLTGISIGTELLFHNNSSNIDLLTCWYVKTFLKIVSGFLLIFKSLPPFDFYFLLLLKSLILFVLYLLDFKLFIVMFGVIFLFGFLEFPPE